MSQKEQQSLFKKLTRLFSSGPSIRRKVKIDSGNANKSSSAVDIFQRARSDIYNSVLSSYGSYDRMARYSDFSEMEATPEIASALDIYAEETVAQDEKGISLHINSDNRKIQELLETLFYDTLNVSFNLPMWVRNLCKYGDFFLFLDVSEEYGIINSYPIPIAEMEREEGFNPENPSASRFRWISQGNTVLENWQIGHFRLLGNDAFLPYGTSVLESARRIWRQLILMEDAMLVYRVIRAPERRVFYIDIGNIPPDSIASYMEEAKSSLKRQPIVDKANGRVDLRYNPYSVDEDYFLPVRGGESGTKIDTLAGGQNASAIEDVQYIQKKLFAALKVPKAYLQYDEDIGAKATLAQEDIRFSRTIARIQKTVISELNKMAMIHLYCHGFNNEDLIDFKLELSNPSSIAQQQKLELISSRFDIAGKAPAGVVDREWIRKNVMNLNQNEIEVIKKGLEDDKLEDLKLENITGDSGEGGDSGAAGGGGGGADPFAGLGGDSGGGDAGSSDLFDSGSESASDENSGAAEEPKEESDDEETFGKKTLLTSLYDDDDDDKKHKKFKENDRPVKPKNQTKNSFGSNIPLNRKKSGGSNKSNMPNFSSIVGVGSKTRKQDTSNDPYDKNSNSSMFEIQNVKNRQFLKELDKFISKKSIKFLNENEDIEINFENLEDD